MSTFLNRGPLLKKRLDYFLNLKKKSEKKKKKCLDSDEINP